MVKYTPENTVQIGRLATVYLDGDEVKNCFEADDELGYVVRGKLDHDGLLYVENGEVATEKLTGTVTVELNHV